MEWFIFVVYFCFANVVVGTGDDVNDGTEWQNKDEYYGSGWQNVGRGLKNDQWQKINHNTEYGRNLEEHNQDYYKNTQNENDNPKYEYVDSKGLGYSDKLYYDEEEKEKLDKIFGFTGPTANDEPENLIRPCALDDWQCIRHYFAAYGDCTPAYGPIPDPLTLDLLTIFFSSINMTITFPNTVITGLSSAKVNEFYVNKKSGNLLFALDVQNLNETSQRAYFRYRRTAKESIVLADYSTVNFRYVTFTAVIPKVPRLRLDLADVHAYLQEGYPEFFFGPGANNSTDPDVISASRQIAVVLPFLVREGLLFNSQLLTSIFIQTTICDFGLKLISV